MIRFLSILGILVGIFSILALFTVTLAVFIKRGRRHHPDHHYFQTKPNNFEPPPPLNPDIIPNFNFPGQNITRSNLSSIENLGFNFKHIPFFLSMEIGAFRNGRKVTIRKIKINFSFFCNITFGSKNKCLQTFLFCNTKVLPM